LCTSSSRCGSCSITTGDRRLFPRVRFYADWAVHPLLDRVKRGSGVHSTLTEINSYVKTYREDGDHDKAARGMHNAVSLELLREDLAACANQYEVTKAWRPYVGAESQFDSPLLNGSPMSP